MLKWLCFKPNCTKSCHKSYIFKNVYALKKNCTPGKPPETQHLTVKSVPGKAETKITCEEKQDKQYWRVMYKPNMVVEKKKIIQSTG